MHTHKNPAVSATLSKNRRATTQQQAPPITHERAPQLLPPRAADPLGSALAYRAPRPTRSRVTMTDGRFPGSRVVTSDHFQTRRFPVVFMAVGSPLTVSGAAVEFRIRRTDRTRARHSLACPCGHPWSASHRKLKRQLTTLSATLRPTAQQVVIDGREDTSDGSSG